MNHEINENYLDSEIDFKELILLFWKKKVTIILLTTAFAVFSVAYALYLPNIYQSKSLLAPTDQQESLSSKLSSYKNLAGLAGVSLPGTGTTKTNEAIERIRSFKFFSEQFLPLIKLENLMALKKWEPENNSLVYDESLYDVKQSKWIRDVKYPLKVIPSEQEAFLTYLEILSINVDDETGFVSISMDHMSPVIAKKWLDIIIMNINTNMRELDKEKAKNSINFLNESSGSTSVQSIKIAIAALLEEQMQTLMLASSDEDYIFKVIDAPIVPEIKSSPSRAIICIVITLLGGFLSLLIVLVQSYYKKIIDFFVDNSY